MAPPPPCGTSHPGASLDHLPQGDAPLEEPRHGCCMDVLAGLHCEAAGEQEDHHAMDAAHEGVERIAL